MVWYGRFRSDWCPFRVSGVGAANHKLTGNTVQMVLSWLMPYFASARRPNRERTTKRHCVRTTWMWHPRLMTRRPDYQLAGPVPAGIIVAGVPVAEQRGGAVDVRSDPRAFRRPLTPGGRCQ